MAHYKRKRSRRAMTNGYSAKGLLYRLKKPEDDLRWLQNWPRWHDKLYHTRPTRRAVHSLSLEVLKGADPDNLVWPNGRKPQIYFW